MAQKIIAGHGLQQMLAVIRQLAHNVFIRILLVRPCIADLLRDSGATQVDTIVMVMTNRPF
jgi:hypothetical protein